MSNRATLTATEFKGPKRDDFGWRLHDDYGNAFDDSWDAGQSGDLALLTAVLEDRRELGIGEVAECILEEVETQQNGMYINGTWYDWEEIKDLFGEWLAAGDLRVLTIRRMRDRMQH